MLTPEKIRDIENFVHQKPRTIQEIAQFLRKNWRTADRYISEISQNIGTIQTRTFREGTRGAMKIVYWSGLEQVSHTVFQEELENRIMHGIKKQDFFPFDVYQFIDSKKKLSDRVANERDLKTNDDFADLILKTKRQLLLFSGDLSYLNIKCKHGTFLDVFEMVVKKKIPIKVICRVDIVGKKNIEKMLSLNFKYKKELIEIHHRDQPLRGAIFDSWGFRFKEYRSKTDDPEELDEDMVMYYTCQDKEWTEWLTRIFYKMFSHGIDAKARLDEINSLR